MSFPAFIGGVSSISGSTMRVLPPRASGWQQLWSVSQPALHLWTRDVPHGRHLRSWTGEGGESATSAFVWGEPLIASDSDLSLETKVERIAEANRAERVVQTYQSYGDEAFARLEGSFSLIIWDRAAQEVLLVVDKFGCDDIYFRKNAGDIEFASHPMLLACSPARLNATAAAFFLAQEGFVPAPFTLFDGVHSVGRAKLLRIQVRAHGVSVVSASYWHLPGAKSKTPPAEAVDRFHRLLADATASRCGRHNGVLLSGGVDSSLLANLISRRGHCEAIALTGAIVGHSESESEMRCAATLSSELGIPHEPVYLDTQEENLPDEWVKCATCCSGGMRITLPLFYRFANRMSERFGAGWSIFSGQMADTLADNNYTVPSFGYAARRMFFSSWFFRCFRLVQRASPRADSRAGHLLVRCLKSLAAPRFSGMLASVLDGLGSPQRFHDGRTFGCGEMPGRSRMSFPVLSEGGFEGIADWYSENYVAPVVQRLTAETFYAGMIELSMDMCMLHLDTRLPLHVMRLRGGEMQLPFLDSRIVNFFASLPYAVRAIYRQPKYVIHAQFDAHGYLRPERRHDGDASRSVPRASPAPSRSAEALLLQGTLGSYFRDLLHAGRLLDRTPELGGLIDQAYFENQLRAFQANRPGVNYKFIARVAALEQWCQMHEEPAFSTAVTIA